MSSVWSAPIAEAVSRLIVEHSGSPDRLAKALTSATEQAIKSGILAERERCASYHDDKAAEHEAFRHDAKGDLIDHHTKMVRFHQSSAEAIRKAVAA